MIPAPTFLPGDYPSNHISPYRRDSISSALDSMWAADISTRDMYYFVQLM